MVRKDSYNFKLIQKNENRHMYFLYWAKSIWSTSGQLAQFSPVLWGYQKTSSSVKFCAAGWRAPCPVSFCGSFCIVYTCAYVLNSLFSLKKCSFLFHFAFLWKIKIWIVTFHLFLIVLSNVAPLLGIGVINLKCRTKTYGNKSG